MRDTVLDSQNSAAVLGLPFGQSESVGMFVHYVHCHAQHHNVEQDDGQSWSYKAPRHSGTGV